MGKTANRAAMENVLSPGRTKDVDADKYRDVREAMLASLPVGLPGITSAELKRLVLPLLSKSLFPSDAKAGWWLKGVPFDLEAEGRVGRSETSPLRLYAVGARLDRPKDSNVEIAECGSDRTDEALDKA